MKQQDKPFPTLFISTPIIGDIAIYICSSWQKLYISIIIILDVVPKRTRKVIADYGSKTPKGRENPIATLFFFLLFVILLLFLTEGLTSTSNEQSMLLIVIDRGSVLL